MWWVAAILDSKTLGCLHLKINRGRRDEPWARYCISSLHIFSLYVFLRSPCRRYYHIQAVSTSQGWEDFPLHSLNTQTMKPSSVIYRKRERERERPVSEQIVKSQPHSRFKRLTFLFSFSPFFFKHPALLINQISLFSKYLPPKWNLQFNLLYKIIYWLINLITKLSHSPWYSRQF